MFDPGEDGPTSPLFDPVEQLSRFFRDRPVIAGSDQRVGDQFGSEPDAGDAGGKPLFDRFPCCLHAAGRHETRPWHRREDALHERRPADLRSGEDLANLHPVFLCLGNLADASTARQIGDLSAVTGPGHLGMEGWSDDKVCPVGDIEGGRAGIEDGTGAEDQIGNLFCAPGVQFGEDPVGEIAAVREFQSPCAPVGHRLGDLFGGLQIVMVKDGNQADLDQGIENVHS